ncbi:MAG: hypothetical protein U0930_02355 [Pirellulales bacterium]
MLTNPAQKNAFCAAFAPLMVLLLAVHYAVAQEPVARSRIEELRSIREHLLLADPSDRPHLRFFTLTHLRGDGSNSSDEIGYVSAAITKLLNSLSWQTEIYVPVSVAGTQGRVLAIDLRKLKWSDGRQWLQIVNQYPYGLKFNYVKDVELKQLANDIQELSGVEMPSVRGDWFVAVASRPPLYPQLLQLPENLIELAAIVGVDLEKSLVEISAVRAGILQSAISNQNRLIERHESKYGALWLSYDFAARSSRSDLIRFPLGPRSTNNPFNSIAFEPDLVQAIFHLPNGLQGYFVADREGNRMDDPLPVEIVHDPRAIAGITAIVNGISCIHCHGQGVIGGFKDQVRSSSVVSGDSAKLLERLYLPLDQMEKLIQRDRQQFLAAARSAMPSLSNADNVEPIGLVIKIYSRDLEPDQVARELGFECIEQIRSQIQNDRELKRLGIGTLISESPSSIKRVRWESVDGTSLFQDVAVELGLGTPVLAGSKRSYPHPVHHVSP